MLLGATGREGEEGEQAEILRRGITSWLHYMYTFVLTICTLNIVKHSLSSVYILTCQTPYYHPPPHPSVTPSRSPCAHVFVVSACRYFSTLVLKIWDWICFPLRLSYSGLRAT